MLREWVESYNLLREKYENSQLIRFDVTLVRRWADLEQTDK